MKYLIENISGIILFILLFLSANHLYTSTDTYKQNTLSGEIDKYHSNDGHVDYVDSKDGWIYFCNESTYIIN